MGPADGALIVAILATIVALIATVRALHKLVASIDRLLKRFDPHPTDPRTNPRKPTWKS